MPSNFTVTLKVTRPGEQTFKKKYTETADTLREAEQAEEERAERDGYEVVQIVNTVAA